MIVLGADPGSFTGGLTVVNTDEKRVYLAYTWLLRHGRGYDLCLYTWDGARYTEVAVSGAPDPWQGAALNHAMRLLMSGKYKPTAAAVEAVQWQGSGGPDTLLLADSGGRICQWVYDHTGLTAVRRAAYAWRKRVLGINPGTKASTCARVALMATEISSTCKTAPRPYGVTSEHVADAICLAWDLAHNHEAEAA